MSRATVRAAVAAYLNAGLGAIPGLATVYQAQPYFVDGANAIPLAAGQGSGAYAFLHLAESSESRWAEPAAQGSVGVHYQVNLVVCYVYQIPSAIETPPVDPSAWVGPCDVILQALKDRIHADPSMGAPATIFLAAQTPDTLQISSDDPRLDQGRIHSWHTIAFRVTEVIQA